MKLLDDIPELCYFETLPESISELWTGGMFGASGRLLDRNAYHCVSRKLLLNHYSQRGMYQSDEKGIIIYVRDPRHGPQFIVFPNPNETDYSWIEPALARIRRELDSRRPRRSY